MANSNAIAIPNMMGGRSMSNPQSGSSANLATHHNFNFSNSQQSSQTPFWTPQRRPVHEDSNETHNRVGHLRGGGGDSFDNASDLDIDIDLSSDVDEGAPVPRPDEQSSSSQRDNRDNGSSTGGRGGGLMMMV